MISKSEIKLIKSLKLKKYRIVNNLFLLEGIKSINEVLNSMSLYLGIEIPIWPPDNIAELSKKLEENI